MLYSTLFDDHQDLLAVWALFLAPNTPLKRLVRRLLETNQIRLTQAKISLLAQNWDAFSTAPGTLLALLID